MDKVEVCEVGVLAQLTRGDCCHATNTEGRWGQYASSTNMPGFGGLTAPSVTQPGHQGHQGHQNEENNRSLGLLGDSKLIACTPPPSGLVGTFGQASPPRHGFDKPLWGPQMTTVTLSMERSLEDLYKDYPEKRLKGIDEDDLDLAARVILQVTSEATMHWITQWCPNVDWPTLIQSAKPAAEPVELGSPYLVPQEATKLGSSATMVAELFCQCHRLRRECLPMHLKGLVRITYQCILLCEALKDQKRKVLLEKVNDVAQWISVGLDCKKINIHKEASDELTIVNQRYGETQDPGPIGLKLDKTQTPRRMAKEMKILDQAIKSFEEHRAEFRMTLLNGLQVLLRSTN